MLMFRMDVVPVFGEMDELRELKKASGVEEGQRSFLRACQLIWIVLLWALCPKGDRNESCAVASISEAGGVNIERVIIDGGLSSSSARGGRTCPM